jgi:hypothetical protein
MSNRGFRPLHNLAKSDVLVYLVYSGGLEYLGDSGATLFKQLSELGLVTKLEQN